MTFTIINSVPLGELGVITKVHFCHEDIIYEQDIEHAVPETIESVLLLIKTHGEQLQSKLIGLKNQATIIEQLNQIVDPQPI